jgi:hypothetical protein
MTARREHAPNLPPRMLSKEQAAAYCGVSPPVFEQACPVKPIQLLERILRYDRFALDQWMNSLDEEHIRQRLNPVLSAWDNKQKGREALDHKDDEQRINSILAAWG